MQEKCDFVPVQFREFSRSTRTRGYEVRTDCAHEVPFFPGSNAEEIPAGRLALLACCLLASLERNLGGAFLPLLLTFAISITATLNITTYEPLYQYCRLRLFWLRKRRWRVNRVLVVDAENQGAVRTTALSQIREGRGNCPTTPFWYP